MTTMDHIFKSRKLFLRFGCFSIGVVVFVAMFVLGWMLLRPLMTGGTVPPLPSTPIIVTLTKPVNQVHYPAGEPIPVEAAAVSASPLETFEFLVNGKLEETIHLSRPPMPGSNLALGATVTTSANLPENPGNLAIDGNSSTYWSTGGNPVQWIDIDLGSEQNISTVRLIPKQYTEGETTHQILTKLTPDGEYRLLTTITGRTVDGIPIEFTPPYPWTGVRFLRIETLSSPSVVAWYEIEIIAAEASLSKSATWYWVPPTPGDYLLQVRAKDSNGQVNLSNLVHVTAVEGNPGVLMNEYIAEGGETPREIAQDMGIPPEYISQYNSSPLDEPLPPGEVILIPTESLPDSAEDEEPEFETIPEPVLSPSLPETPLSALPSSTDSVPEPPGLMAIVEGCSVHLSVQPSGDDALGFIIYRLGANEASFSALAYLDPGSPVFTDGGAAGNLQYYASAFNSLGETPGMPVNVQITDPNCGVHVPVTADPRVENGTLVTNHPVNVAYIYLSYDTTNWERLPAADGSFIPFDGKGFSLANLLPDLARPFWFEAWGWDNGNLLYLGKGTNQGTILQDGVLQGRPLGRTFLYVHAPILDSPDNFASETTTYWNWTPEQMVIRFKWATLSGGSEGIWQVSLLPFTSAPDLNPPGLLATGKVTSGDPYFTIDFSGLVHPDPGPQNTAPYPTPTSFWPPLNRPIENVTLGLGLGESMIPSKISILPTDKYYVRIIPLKKNNQIAGDPSNTVVVHYDPPPGPFQVVGPLPPAYQVKIVSYYPGTFPDGNKWGCVKIIKEDPNYPFPSPGIYEIGQVVCPKPWSGGNKFSAWDILDFLIDAWNWAADMISEIKKFAIDILEKFSPLCWQYKLAVEATGGVLPPDGCKAAISVAVDATLTAYGIPPSMPNFDQLTNEGMDYLVDLAAEEITAATGVPCVDICKDVLRDALDEGVKAVQSMSVEPACGDEQAAHERGREPLCIVGYIVKPVQGSVYEDPVATLEVTRKALVGVPPGDYSSCHLFISALFTQQYPGGTVSGPYGSNKSIEVPPQQLSDVLFKGYVYGLEMAPGTTRRIPVTLKPYNTALKFPWTLELWKDSQILQQKIDGLTPDWFKLYYNSTIEVSVTGEYFGVGSSGPCIESTNTWTEKSPKP